MNVIIAIPSYGRAQRMMKVLSTIRFISPTYYASLIYYVEKEEEAEYRSTLASVSPLIRVRTTERAEVPKRWGAIMDLIIDECSQECDVLYLMDDDLKLAYRPELPKNTIVEMSHEKFDEMIENVAALLSEDTPLTAPQYRQFCNTPPKVKPLYENGRISMIWCLDAKFFREHPEYRFYRESKLPFMADYYFFLKLLVNGYRNVCDNRYLKDDIPNAPGGEQSKRKIEILNESAVALQKMFPQFVTAYVKVGKQFWEDGALGVKIEARKAYEYGRAQREKRA